MAVTVTVSDQFVVGDRLGVVFSVAWDSSYATGGESVSLASLKARNKVSFISSGVARDSSGNTAQISWDGSATAPKLIASRTDQVDDFGEQLPDTTSLSGYTSRHFAFVK